MSFHILNNFDIPKGSIREDLKDNGVMTEYTLWTSASDTQNLVYYFKTYEGQDIESIDIVKVLDGLEKPKTLKMDKTFVIRARTADF